MKTNPKPFGSRGNSPRTGFTLIEVMISLLLGIIVIGGIVTVFISNQQTYRATVALDNSQEAFRFASHTVTRVVRASRTVLADSDAAILRLALPQDGITRNCLGRRLDWPTSNGELVVDENGLPPTQINVFRLEGEDLVCEVDGQGSIMVTGVDTLRFSYAFLNPNNYEAGRNSYVAGSPPEGTNAVRTEITMVDGGGMIRPVTISFTAAVRTRLVPEEIVVRP